MHHPLIRLKRASFSLVALVLLAACGTPPPADIGVARTIQNGTLPYSTEHWQESQDSCPPPKAHASTSPCPGMSINLARFPSQAALNQRIEVQLLDMLADSPFDTRSLAALRQSFLRTAGPRDTLVLKAQPYRETAHLLILRLEAGYYAGGANSMEQAEFLIWAPAQQRALSLTDLLEPDATPRFEALLRQAFEDWLRAKNLSPAAQADYLRIWPYQASHDVALDTDGLRVQYPMYAIAPRSDGMPSFLIPYPSLDGVLRPAYLPGETP